MKFGNGFEQLFRGCLLEYITGRASSQGLENPIVILKHCEHGDLNLWLVPFLSADFCFCGDLHTHAAVVSADDSIYRR